MYFRTHVAKQNVIYYHLLVENYYYIVMTKVNNDYMLILRKTKNVVLKSYYLKTPILHFDSLKLLLLFWVFFCPSFLLKSAHHIDS